MKSALRRDAISRMNDPLWTRTPRWIEESGLPAQLRERHGALAWPVFRSLVAIDCDRNLTPDWFSFDMKRLAQSSGTLPAEAVELAGLLTDDELIETRQQSDDSWQGRIRTPLKTPIEPESILRSLAESHGGRFALRYATDVDAMSKAQRVVYFYQMTFGARFTPRIVEELEEIANDYDISVIYDIFSEASRRSIKRFSWIKSKLSAGRRDEEPAEQR